MSGALEIAMVGMRAQQRALEAVAGNVSNINTPAFKRIDLQFSELIGAQAGPPPDEARVAIPASVAGVIPAAMPQFDIQGAIERTGNPLDLAIEGLGFVELLGPGGQTLLWRGGTLRVMEDGALATNSGSILKAGITLPDDMTAVRIDRDGKVFVTQAGIDGESLLGEIPLVKIVDPLAVERLDGGVFQVLDEGSLFAGAPGERGLGSFVQGSRERSNVDLNSEMIALLVAQRAYTANAQIVRAADEFYGIANGLRK